DAKRCERAPSFDLPNRTQGGSLFITHGIAAPIAARTEDYGHPTMVLVDRLCKITGNHRFIVRVAYHDEYVSFVAVILPERRPGLRKLRGGAKARKKYEPRQ